MRWLSILYIQFVLIRPYDINKYIHLIELCKEESYYFNNLMLCCLLHGYKDIYLLKGQNQLNICILMNLSSRARNKLKIRVDFYDKFGMSMILLAIIVHKFMKVTP